MVNAEKPAGKAVVDGVEMPWEYRKPRRSQQKADYVSDALRRIGRTELLPEAPEASGKKAATGTADWLDALEYTQSRTSEALSKAKQRYTDAYELAEAGLGILQAYDVNIAQAGQSQSREQAAKMHKEQSEVARKFELWSASLDIVGVSDMGKIMRSVEQSSRFTPREKRVLLFQLRDKELEYQADYYRNISGKDRDFN